MIQSEKNKRNNRWSNFYANNVWETRKTPPTNWNEPLPDYIAKRRSMSTLKDNLDEYNTGSNSGPLCSIM